MTEIDIIPADERRDVRIGAVAWGEEGYVSFELPLDDAILFHVSLGDAIAEARRG